MDARTSLTRVLPTSWILLGYKNNQLIVNVKGGAEIRDPLARTQLNPSPSATLDEIGLDKGMKWMVDFSAAEEAGMGIRVKLSKEQATEAWTSCWCLASEISRRMRNDSTTRLTELFNAHHYTNGLSFIKPGTPSNNTAETPSGFSSEDPGHETSYQAERIASAFQRGDGSISTRSRLRWACPGNFQYPSRGYFERATRRGPDERSAVASNLGLLPSADAR